MSDTDCGASRLLIVNADDFGLTPGVCEAVLRAHAAGIVSSTSALVVGPAWAGHAAALAASGVGVGAHLCVVGEDPPILTAREVPTLVDGRGRFPLSWREFVGRAICGRVDLDDVRREFNAQLDVLADSGITPTHLDSHQHLHHYPGVAEVVIDLAVTHHIGAVRVARSSTWSVGSIGIRLLGNRLERHLVRSDLVAPAASAGLDQAGRMTLPTLLDTIGQLGRGVWRSAEIGVHPGLSDDPHRNRYRWGYWWAEELDALCHRSARAAVERHGFVLADFADLVAAGKGEPSAVA